MLTEEPSVLEDTAWDCRGAEWQRDEWGWRFVRRPDGTEPVPQEIRTWSWVERRWGPMTLQRPGEIPAPVREPDPEAAQRVILAAVRWREQHGEFGPLDSADTPAGDLFDAVDAYTASAHPQHDDVRVRLPEMAARLDAVRALCDAYKDQPPPIYQAPGSQHGKGFNAGTQTFALAVLAILDPEPEED